MGKLSRAWDGEDSRKLGLIKIGTLTASIGVSSNAEEMSDLVLDDVDCGHSVIERAQLASLRHLLGLAFATLW